MKKIDHRPWSPLALTLLALVLPLGAPIVAVRNLERLDAIDGRTARFYTWAAAALIASIYVLIWSFDPRMLDPNAIGKHAGQLLPVSIGAPVACYMIQINSFRKWRQSHPEGEIRPWYSALLPMVGLELLVVILASVAIDVLRGIFHTPV